MKNKKQDKIAFVILFVTLILLIGFVAGFLIGRITAPEQLIIIKDLPPVQLP